MNDLLQVKLPWGHVARNANGGPSELPVNQSVTSEKLSFISSQIRKLIDFWVTQDIIADTLVSVEYTKVVAKSNRIKQLFSHQIKDINSQIRGAKFVGDEKAKRHVITYNLPLATLRQAYNDLSIVIKILNTSYQGIATHNTIKQINRLRSGEWNHTEMKKNAFVNLIVDCFYVESMYVPRPDAAKGDTNIVTIYEAGYDLVDTFIHLGIPLTPKDILNRYTIVLRAQYFQRLFEKAPYLIAMSLTDISKIPPMNTQSDDIFTPFTIRKPANEPTIGVIDTFFDDSVYFSDWVEIHNEIPDYGITIEDKIHGTAIDSIIVDGARINPDLDDGCGNFRVRHFSAMTSKFYKSTSIMNIVERVVEENPDIKVWNISLGSNNEIHPNYLSYEAAVLDRLQSKYEDIIFVIAGTNDTSKTMNKRIGAPADSINSLVVNSVNMSNEAASYSRKGPVLAFYNKPDLSYYGGDVDHPIRVCTRNGAKYVTGTSFAAPFIARKLAYLIHILGLPREIAKALIIDSTIGWTENTLHNTSSVIGLGIVPVHINNIIHSKDDEIRFYFTGEATEYDNYCYSIPVPISKGKQPYIAKATLCYFPEGARNQGVDYTCTELDLHFGRITSTGIRTINNNQQNTDESREYEKDARSYHRKWDNTKVICERLSQKGRPKEVYQKGLWGISIKKTERNSNKKHKALKFGMVITLKNTNGDNLINNFIQQCAWNNILVSPLRIEKSINVYNKLTEDITLE